MAALTLQAGSTAGGGAPRASADPARASDLLRSATNVSALPGALSAVLPPVTPIEHAATARSKVDDQLDLLKQLIEMFTGKKIHGAKTRGAHAHGAATPTTADAVAPSDGRSNASSNIASSDAANNAANDAASVASTTADFAMSEDYAQSDQITIHADGVLHTADGHDVKFSLSLDVSHEMAMHRELHAQSNGAANDGNDPLRVDYAGSVEDLQSIHFQLQFDQSGNADGSATAPTNGSLTFDRSAHVQQSQAGTLYRPPDQRPLSSMNDIMQSLHDWEHFGDSVLREMLAQPSGVDQFAQALGGGGDPSHNLQALLSSLQN